MAWPFTKRGPLAGFLLLRKLLAEQRATRQALERLADAVELAISPPGTVQGQTFRSYTRSKEALDEKSLKDLTAVSYVDSKVLAGMLRAEDELRAVLGRDPTEQEIERAYRGDVE